MSHDEMIAVIRAHKQGKAIQVNLRSNGPSGGWIDEADAPRDWDFSRFDYRVKPGAREWWIREYGMGVTPDAFTSEKAARALLGDDIALIHVREVLP